MIENLTFDDAEDGIISDTNIDIKIENYVPEEIKIIETIQDITQADLVEAIKACLKVSPLINPSPTLVNSVYNIMKGLFIDNKQYAIIEAPTGSGKTIIGFMCYFVTMYLYNKKNNYPQNAEIPIRPEIPESQLTYFLTSAKMLQEQIDKDLDRFDFRNFIFMMKGRDNYDCTHETDRIKANFKKFGTYEKDKNGKDITRISYVDRPCKGMDKKERTQKYFHCDPECPYQVARFEASDKSMTIFNYAYFLNVMRADYNPFFGSRLLTIADEAHLIPDIVCNTFNFEFTQFALNQLHKLGTELELNFGYSTVTSLLMTYVTDSFELFRAPIEDKYELIETYYSNMSKVSECLLSIQRLEKYESYKGNITKNMERITELLINQELFLDLIHNRPEDIFIESNLITEDKFTDTKVYKHIVKDMSEAKMVKKHFLSKVNKCILMSATLGDVDQYATLMGIEENEYVGLRLPSSFDFSKSPIFICKSGWLNYKNFDSNIDKVLMDCFKICNELHPTEKGIIHTSTFRIAQLMKEKIINGIVPDKTRYLFYANSDEKEKAIELMKNSMKPYIIVGPSLYEGIDLKDEQGRFNILVKVPYAQINDYIKKKMLRFPFWYERNVIEKIIQSIGRTNRHVNDYSSVYLLDSLFDKNIWNTNESIVSRIQYKTIR